VLEGTELGISSLMDTWLLLRDIELNGERNRGIYVLKSRGMAHSNQIREFLVTSKGIKLVDVYLGPEGVLTGSSRLAQEAKEAAAALQDQQEMARKQCELERKRRVMEAQIAAIRAAFDAEAQDIALELNDDEKRKAERQQDRMQMAASRKANGAMNKGNGSNKRKIGHEIGHSSKK
jgi:circadian clock protein KaiC